MKIKKDTNIRRNGYYRKQRIKHIKKKYEKRSIAWGLEATEDYYQNVAKGTLSKGKIHCSCWMCSSKTKRNGWKHSEKKAISAMNKEIYDYERNNL